jgi:hypothetical protein
MLLRGGADLRYPACRMTLSAFLRLLGVALLVLATAGPHAGAQSAQDFMIMQLTRRQPPPVQPQRPTRARAGELEDDEVRPRTRARAGIAAPLVERPAVEASIFVHVLGDSLAELLWQGFRETFVDRGEIAVIKRARTSSGLVRDDYFDWAKAARELVNGPDRIDLAVMMIGSNDRQPLKDETGVAQPFTRLAADERQEFNPRWRELYARRVDDIIAIFKERNIPLLWVGMPVMQSARLTADMQSINEILRERTGRAGVPFVDIWEGFVNDQGQYASSGPDVAGEIVKLRTADGIHFTRAGGRKAAFFAEKEANRLLGGFRPVDVAALPPDVNEQIRRESPTYVPPELQSMLPPTIDPLDIPLAVVRPLAGPTVPLLAPAVSPQGDLVRGRPAPMTQAAIERDQVLVYGQLPTPKPGRADDFRWPRERPVRPAVVAQP